MLRAPTRRSLSPALALLLLAACSSDPARSSGRDAAPAAESPDAAAVDAEADAGVTDASVGDAEDGLDARADAEPLADAGETAADAEPLADAEPVADAGEPAVPLPGYGTITGECGVLDDTEWTSAAPFFFASTIDFGTTAYDPMLFTAAGREVIADGNAGGSSIESEAVSADLLARCELATLLKTENEVNYTDPMSKKTDLLVELDGRKIGVSVTRAYHFPESNPYTEAEAAPLITRKLNDMLVAQANAVPADAWVRSMLYVVAYSPEAAQAMAAAWTNLDPTVKADHIVIVTQTNGDDAFIY